MAVNAPPMATALAPRPKVRQEFALAADTAPPRTKRNTNKTDTYRSDGLSGARCLAGVCPSIAVGCSPMLLCRGDQALGKGERLKRSVCRTYQNRSGPSIFGSVPSEIFDAVYDGLPRVTVSGWAI